MPSLFLPTDCAAGPCIHPARFATALTNAMARGSSMKRSRNSTGSAFSA
jgi:hypothetical protein